ncbi:MAG TPA: hypothetical protein VH396_02425 [Chitinophagaceae bacterium]|jgi:hypothetical protein
MSKTVTTANKKPAKKSVEGKSETGIKYSDKSIDQPELVPVYEELKELLLPYQKGRLKARRAGGQYHLISDKEVEVAGKKRNDIYFASLLVQKGYVGFYYIPVYADPAIKKNLKPELLKCLKGKSCFHIKKLDDELRTQIKDALKVGYAYYEKLGWI